MSSTEEVQDDFEDLEILKPSSRVSDTLLKLQSEPTSDLGFKKL